MLSTMKLEKRVSVAEAEVTRLAQMHVEIMRYVKAELPGEDVEAIMRIQAKHMPRATKARR